jgi:hypothetical protein
VVAQPHQVNQFLSQVKLTPKSKESINRRSVFLRDDFRCQYCSCPHNLTIDHLVPVSKGGPWSWENLVTACTTCNTRCNPNPTLTQNPTLTHVQHHVRIQSKPGGAEVTRLASSSELPRIPQERRSDARASRAQAPLQAGAPQRISSTTPPLRAALAASHLGAVPTQRRHATSVVLVASRSRAGASGLDPCSRPPLYHHRSS